MAKPKDGLADLVKMYVCSEKGDKVKFFPPPEKKCIAITNKPKTTALIYDQVWWRAKRLDLGWASRPMEGCVQWCCAVSYDRNGGLANLGIELPQAISLRTFDEMIRRKYSPYSVVVYGSKAERDREYTEGDRQVILAILDGLQMVDEEHLSWDQVYEFRKDKKAQMKYRRLVHWLDKSMVGKSLPFIEDQIGIMIDDYECAMRKHGLKTALGTIEETLEGKYLAGVAGTAGAITFAGTSRAWYFSSNRVGDR